MTRNGFIIKQICGFLPEKPFLQQRLSRLSAAEKINLLADSPKLRREMGEYNRSKVEKMFTIDRMVGEYKDLFEQVLSRH